MMKRQLLLAATLLTGGLSVPASAQYHSSQCNSRTEVYISGYLPCGAPIYARRVVSSRPHYHRDHYYREQVRIQREREYRRQLEIQRRLAYQRELERRRYYQSQRSRHYYQPPRCR